MTDLIADLEKPVETAAGAVQAIRVGVFLCHPVACS
jgi:hypothetical protein